MNSVPDLPIDVARYIMELAAKHCRKSAHNLVYVSKAVREWIDPILYHTVVLQKEVQRLLFIRSCMDRVARDPDFYARNVKVLCIQGSTTYPVVEFILICCSGAEVLAAWFYMSDGTPYPGNLIRSMNARRLSLPSDVPHLVARISPNVTHLNLQHHPFDEERINWEDLFQCCPHLTHILFDIDADQINGWDDLLADETVSKFRELLKAAPPSFKALIFEVLQCELYTSSYETATYEEGLSKERYRVPGRLRKAKEFFYAATDLINALSDERFVFVIPNNRFADISGLVFYEYLHNPLLDWGYRVVGELDAYEVADRYLST